MAAKIPVLLCLLVAAFVKAQVEVDPPKAVVVRSGDVSMRCKVAYPIDSCRIRVGGVTYSLREKIVASDNVQYYGSGYQNGECGVRIIRVDESMNGDVICSVPPITGSVELEGVMKLVIAKAPDQPILSLNVENVYNSNNNIYNSNQHQMLAGGKLMAKCEVPHGRPAANLSWLLGEEQLYSDLHQVVILDEPSSDLKTVSQNLTRTLRAEDDGKSLVCIADHQALSSPYRVQRQLEVQYKPQAAESTQLTMFGVRLHQAGLLNVTVRANPPPQAVWTLGSVRLNLGQVDDEDKYEARPLHPLGNGWYLISLLIRNVEKTDVDRQYILTVSNVHGREDFTVKISTNDEPEAIQLDAGSIVGIVVAVIVLVLAVALLAFARTTHRWCFAERGDQTDARQRSSGESSDTESAVGGAQAARRRLPDLSRAIPALRSVLPSRGRKDKVVAEPQPETKAADDEEKPLQEGEKKSIVYAELSLATPAVAAPVKPTPESTEYAEIVYGTPPTEPQTKNEQV